MPTTFQLADTDVTDELATVMQKWHPRLHVAEVRVGVLFALNPSGPAVKHGGYPVLASIKIVSLKDRVTKGYDAELLIDDREWHDLRAKQRPATLDHELMHIDLRKWWESPVPDKKGNPTDEMQLHFESDDLSRPKLKSVKGDWSAGDGFAVVCRRHGLDAIEYENLTRCRNRADAARREGERERGE